MKITNINRSNIKEIREAVTNALWDLEQNLGIKCSIGSITFSDNSFSAKLSGVTESTGSVEKGNWDTYCIKWGFKKEHFGQVVKIQGNMYEIAGCKPASWKNPILVKKLSDGKIYKVSDHMVRGQLYPQNV